MGWIHSVLILLCVVWGPVSAQLAGTVPDNNTTTPPTAPVVPQAGTPVNETAAEVPEATIEAPVEQDVAEAPAGPGNWTTARLLAELPENVRSCGIYMGNQFPREPKREDIGCGYTESSCRKDRGRLPIYWDWDGTEADRYREPEPGIDSNLTACIANCTVARDCNYITYRPITRSTGWCQSYHIDADCHQDNGERECFDLTGNALDVGIDLGKCPFAAEPQGDFLDNTFAFFRQVKSSTSEALAIAASVITIVAAFLGAPCTFVSKLLKA